MKEDGGPAFPSANKVACGGWETEGHSGMTLRDWFAGMAVLAAFDMLKTVIRDVGIPDKPAYQVSEWCYEIADAMLKEREK